VAKDVVESAQNEAEFELEVVFIDGDPELEKLFGEEVPVTIINGKRHDYFRVDRTRFIEAVLHPHQ
jgi:shikimate kinase